jgi:hypothetical protein
LVRTTCRSYTGRLRKENQLVLLRWAVRQNVALDAFANLARFADRMYVNPAVRTVIQVEESAVDLAA